VHDFVETLGAAMAVEKVRLAKAGVQRAWEGLAASDEGPPSPAAIAVVFFLRLGFVDVCFDDGLDIADLDEDVFGL